MKFEEASLPPEAFSPSFVAAKFKVSMEVAEKLVRHHMQEKVYLSATHQVNVRDAGPYTHLSIKRIDKEPEHDWRVLQDIKTSLCGPEAEAIELYPAESRVIDMANQFHLWVLKDNRRFPVGWDEGRQVSSAEEAAAIGAKQREIDHG